MTPIFVLLCALGLGLIGWFAARAKAQAMFTGRGSLHSLPGYHGWHLALWIFIPAFAGWALWQIISPGLIEAAILSDPAAKALPSFGFQRDAILSEARNLALNSDAAVFNQKAAALVPAFQAAISKFNWMGAFLTLILAFVGGAWGYTKIKADYPARTRVERSLMMLLLLASTIAVLTTIGIVASLVFETGVFFGFVSPMDFLFGTQWAPDPFSSATRTDIGEDYGAIPLFWGTIFIGAIIAMIVAIPLGLMSAIYLTQYADARVRSYLKPVLEILAGIPTVVYGYFAALTVAPLVRDFAGFMGMANPSTESALAAGMVMGIMIIPFVSSMADDSIAAVPSAMRDGSLAMGATKSETIKRVLIPAALPGIVAGIMLAISRAIGETMIVYMAAGAAAKLSANPFDSMTTVTFQIAKLLNSDGEFNHPATLAAFALGLVLFVVTLMLNIIALRVVKRFREAYE
jgi:phosphate transport system permease protein